MNPIVRKSLVGAGIVATIGAIAFGVYLFYKRQIQLALQYCYKISNLKFIKVSKENLTMQIFVKIQNKSDFTVDLKGYDLIIELNDKQIAKITSDSLNDKLVAKSITELSFMVSCNPSEIYDPDYVADLIVYAITDRKKIIIKVLGTLNVKMDFVNIKKLKFDYSTNVYDILNAPPSEKVKCDIV
jgi:LEA14-like dessication related protein